MTATNEQVTTWSNQRTRPYCEDLRSVLIQSEDNNASIGEVYANITASPTWADNRHDAPANLTPNDILAINTISVQLAKVLRGQLANDAEKIAACNDIASQLPIVLKACVRSVK